MHPNLSEAFGGRGLLCFIYGWGVGVAYITQSAWQVGDVLLDLSTQAPCGLGSIPQFEL